MPKRRGRPAKQKKSGTMVTLYLTDPVAKVLHKKLTAGNKASEFYQNTLKTKLMPRLPNKMQIEILEKAQHEVIEMYNEKMAKQKRIMGAELSRINDKIKHWEEAKAAEEAKDILEKK